MVNAQVKMGGMDFAITRMEQNMKLAFVKKIKKKVTDENNRRKSN
jgi:hypothetical protein